jgi:dihydropteroate synthase
MLEKDLKKSGKFKMTKVVGILNITPDSFFDGAKFYDIKAALDHLKILINDGASVIDIGAESTRPGAVLIGAEEEWQRLKDILPQAINFITNYNKNNLCDIKISLDSRHPQNVLKALDYGIDIINDVSGFENLLMVDLAVQSGKKIIVMHNLGVPANQNKIVDQKLDIVEVLIDWIKNKLQNLQQRGIKQEQIIFDIGIGFGKNAQQSIELLQKIDRLKALKIPLYVGHSNKSFLNYLRFDNKNSFSFDFKSDSIQSKEDKTFIISSYLTKKNVEYIRVHNVAKNICFQP